ncbi:HNH endonuclease [Salinisphaera sp. USBA-960]|nr:HNH endonuclease [Salifodinibacter halophilus]NNC27266.1 HNH endonuclease [Salifodinibacter halophilus]
MPHRPGNWALRTSRWQAVRLQAKRRDGFKCTQCGSRHRLEVHHIKPVRTHPELAFDVANTATLCASCHNAETRRELGQSPPDPERAKWRELIRRS